MPPVARQHFLRRVVLLAGLVALAGVLVSPAGAVSPDGETVPLDVYWQRVGDARDAVRAARSLDGAERSAALARAAAALASVDAVVLPDGATVPVDNGALIAALRADEPDLEQLDRTLSALRAAANDRTVAPTPPPDAEQRLAAVLARPEFQYQPPSALQQELDRLALALFDLLVRLWASPLFTALVIAGGTLLLVAVLIFVARDLLRTGAAASPWQMPVPGAEENLTALEAFDRAQGLAAGGDYRSAVRYLYLATLRFLEEAGRLRYDRALTNREYLRQVAGQADVVEPLGAVIATFDRVWYGFAPMDEHAYRAYVEHVQSLRRVKVA